MLTRLVRWTMWADIGRSAIVFGQEPSRRMCAVQRMKTWIWLLACLSSLVVGIAHAAPQKDPLAGGRWESLGTQDKVKLARMPIKGSNLFAVRGESVIHSPVAKVASVIYDATRWAEWADAMKEVRILQRGPGTELIVYQSFDMPPLVSDRDTVYKYDMVWQGDRIRIWGSSVRHPRAPKTIGIRSELIIGRWYLTPLGPNRTLLVAEVLMDPRGSLPAWVVNHVQRDYPADTINHIRKQASRADVKPVKLPPRPGQQTAGHPQSPTDS